MKTIKLIDLLNKIANYEEVPNKIIFDRVGYNLSGNTYVDGDGDSLKQSLFCDFSNLNDKVEIIEEKKIPEKLKEIGKIDYDLGFIDYKNIEVLKKWLNNDIQSILNELDLIVKNQNQIIDYLESKEKGE